MTQPATPAAPEIKAYPDALTAAFEDYMGTFEAFRETNDRRLSEIEKKLSADVVTEEKLDRINRAIDENKKVLDDMLLKKARPPLQGGRDGRGSQEDQEYKAAFDAFLRRGDEQALRQLDVKQFQSGASADGGTLVPWQAAHEVGRKVSNAVPMRQLATVIEISSNQLKKPFATNSLPTAWGTETAKRDATTVPAPSGGSGTSQTMADLVITVGELYATPVASQAMIEDAVIDLEAWISGEVEIAFAEAESQAFMVGDGNNKPLGIFKAAFAADTTPPAFGTLGYVATGAANAFINTSTKLPSDNLFELVYALKAGYRQNGTFLMSRKTQQEVRKIKDTTNNYIWHPPAAVGQSAALLGFPVVESEDAPDFTAGGCAIAFGDFRAGYIIVDRRGISMLRDPFTSKPNVMFYVTKRVGGGIQNSEAIKLLKFAAS